MHRNSRYVNKKWIHTTKFDTREEVCEDCKTIYYVELRHIIGLIYNDQKNKLEQFEPEQIERMVTQSHNTLFG